MPLRNENPQWGTHGRIRYHLGLMQKGIVVVSPNTSLDDVLKRKQIDDNHFSITNRKFAFSFVEETTQNNQSSQAKTSRKALSLLKKFTDYVEDTIPHKNYNIVYNEERREEVFVPFEFSAEQRTALYTYPWLSKNAAFEFSGFDRFVTAGCLFGSSLRGMDQHEATFPLIKHDIKFFAGQKIEAIIVDEEANAPYEMMLLEQFEQYANFIAKFSTKNKTKELIYHLPYYDYILFGVELLIKDRITEEAFINLVDVIFERKQRHKEKITEICEDHAIKIKFQSPFKNLFPTKNGKETSQFLLAILQTIADTSEKEIVFVQYCLEKLRVNTICSLQSQLWHDFVTLKKAKEVGETPKFDSIESLFKVANAIMIATTAHGLAPYKTCSILPLSEKQIQVEYASFCKDLRSTDYPPVVNITTLDNLVTYGPKSDGLPFYYTHCLDDVSTLITNEKALRKAEKNTYRFFTPTKDDLAIEESEQLICSSSPREPRI